MDLTADESPVNTALALSKRAHEAVESMGLPDLALEWQARVERGDLSEQIAARLITVGAVYPSDAVVWLSQSRPELAQSPAQSVRSVLDDDELGGHGLVLEGTLAETLGRNPDVPVETASLLVGLLDRERA